jgi:protein TonB
MLLKNAGGKKNGFTPGKRMKYQFWTLPASVAFHAVIILLLILLGSSFVRSDRIIVMDFTLENPATTSAKTFHVKKSKAGTVRIIRNDESKAEDRKPAVVEQVQKMQEAIPEIVNVKNQSIQQSSIVEAHIPDYPAGEKNKESEDKAGQDFVNNVSSIVSGATESPSGKEGELKTDAKTASAGGPVNIFDMGRMRYLKEHFAYIKGLVQKNIIYPEIARKMGWKGKVTVSFVIESDGQAHDIEIRKSSGIKVLDQNAVEAVRKASPFPKPPAEAQIIIPIFYMLR